MSEVQSEITIRNIDVALTKVNIQPGDVLLVSVPAVRQRSDLEFIKNGFQEAFGVPAVVLTNGMKVEAVLTVAPECLERAAAERARSAEEVAENIRKVLGR